MSVASEELRASFKAADDVRDAGLTTPEDIVRYDDIIYGADEQWNKLDVYRPKDKEGEKLPILVSVHGGGWVYGDKERYQFYCMNLAQRGFVVVNYTYRLAPEFKYPAAFEDTNDVFSWIYDHKEEYGMDTENIFAVGDSAGAHMLGLYAAICTNPDCAKDYEFKIPEGMHFNAIGLNCGAYRIDLNKDPDDLTVKLMADYLPEKGSARELELLSIENYITEKYPPTIYMTCTGDFLTGDAIILEQKLMQFQIPHTFCFYGDPEHELGHVFHLNIRSQDAEICNDEECAFFAKYMN